MGTPINKCIVWEFLDYHLIKRGLFLYVLSGSGMQRLWRQGETTNISTIATFVFELRQSQARLVKQRRPITKDLAEVVRCLHKTYKEGGNIG